MYVIKVENLGKKFIIGHQKKEKYTTLRDVLANNVKGLIRRTRELANSNYQVEGDTEEEFWALQQINFEIEQGDRVGIIGRNGAGKSTLLKILSRITEPTKGKISLRGRVASLLEVGTGFHPELTGRENIFLNGAILGMSRAEIRMKFDEIVAFAEVEKFLDTPVKRYSSGMYVRLAFAVAAHLEPEILIVDEVLAVGDAQFQKKCLGKMEDVSRNQGRAVLFVSHNMGIIAQLCTKGILLEKGRMVAAGEIRSVIDQYIGLGASNEDLVYQVPLVGLNKPNFFTKIFALDGQGNPTKEFPFDEPIRLRFDFKVNEYNSNLQIGIGLQDKYQSRILTILKPIEYFKMGADGSYSGIVEFPHSIIAPNIYSFVFALWTRNGNVYDIVENIGPIRIHDSKGTDLSLYDGVDYGHVILNPTWENV